MQNVHKGCVIKLYDDETYTILASITSENKNKNEQRKRS